MQSPATAPGSSKTVPFYAKAGWVAAWLLVVIFLAMISRNCVSSVSYGRNTDQLMVEACYRQGILDGREGRTGVIPSEAMKNTLLRKAYNKGYRQGVDLKGTLKNPQDYELRSQD